MANGIRTGNPRGFNKGHSLMFREGSRVRQTPEEGRRTYQPKRCGNNNKDEDTSSKTPNDKNQQASSQKFRQLKSQKNIEINNPFLLLRVNVYIQITLFFSIQFYLFTYMSSMYLFDFYLVFKDTCDDTVNRNDIPDILQSYNKGCNLSMIYYNRHILI